MSLNILCTLLQTSLECRSIGFVVLDLLCDNPSIGWKGEHISFYTFIQAISSSAARQYLAILAISKAKSPSTSPFSFSIDLNIQLDRCMICMGDCFYVTVSHIICLKYLSEKNLVLWQKKVKSFTFGFVSLHISISPISLLNICKASLSLVMRSE